MTFSPTISNTGQYSSNSICNPGCYPPMVLQAVTQSITIIIPAAWHIALKFSQESPKEKPLPLTPPHTHIVSFFLLLGHENITVCANWTTFQVLFPVTIPLVLVSPNSMLRGARCRSCSGDQCTLSISTVTVSHSPYHTVTCDDDFWWKLLRHTHQDGLNTTATVHHLGHTCTHGGWHNQQNILQEQNCFWDKNMFHVSINILVTNVIHSNVQPKIFNF